MSGVTKTIAGSDHSRRNRTLLWLNIEVALSSSSKRPRPPLAPPAPPRSRFDRGGQDNLKRVKTQPRGHVELKVGVMHAMQPPERRHGMKEHVLQVDGEVQEDDRDHNAPPGRKRDHIEESPAMRLGNERETDGGDRKDECGPAACPRRRRRDCSASASRVQSPAGVVARNSQIAMAAKTPPNAARRISGSYANKASRMARTSLLDKTLNLLLFNHSIE